MQRPVAISYAVFSLLLVLVAALHLATPLLAALFCYLALTKLAFWNKKWIGVTLFLIVIAGVFCGSVFFLRRAVIVLPEIVENAVPIVVRYAEQKGVELPFTDVESLRTVALESVRDTLGHLGKYVKIATKEFVFLLVGVVVALGIFLNPDFEPGLKKLQSVPNLYSYYCDRIRERFISFFKCFDTVIGAQLVISTINTLLTGIFLYALSFPYAPVVMILTFVCGLLPIIGNLISNSVIIAIGFTISPKMAAWALVYLVIIHKLEYFLNSQIIGGRINHPMWLTLLALIIGERLMGISGIILAPVILSFIKVEMKKIELAPAFEPPQLEEPVPGGLVETR